MFFLNKDREEDHFKIVLSNMPLFIVLLYRYLVSYLNATIPYSLFLFNQFLYLDHDSYYFSTFQNNITQKFSTIYLILLFDYLYCTDQHNMNHDFLLVFNKKVDLAIN